MFFRDWSPADYVGTDRLIGLEVAPLIIEAAAGIGDHICPVFILAQSFDWDFVCGIFIENKSRHALLQFCHRSIRAYPVKTDAHYI